MFQFMGSVRILAKCFAPLGDAASRALRAERC